jgi:hypothetical protein
LGKLTTQSKCNEVRVPKARLIIKMCYVHVPKVWRVCRTHGLPQQLAATRANAAVGAVLLVKVEPLTIVVV